MRQAHASSTLAPRAPAARREAVLPERLRSACATLATLALLAGCWWYLAPPPLGGSTSVAIVDGTSMLPSLHRHDLVLVRPGSHYRVGDVVAYRSRLLHRIVLHRIVAVRDGRYTLRGDNNGFVDPDQPRRGDIVGKRWARVPAAGRIAEALHTPWVAAAVAALLVLAVGIGGRTQRERDGAPES